MGEKAMRTISKYTYLDVAQNFHWAMKDHFILWLTGELKRHRRTETMLPRLVKKGKLIAKNHGRRIIYTAPRRKNDKHFNHGLACTEGLVRMYLSKKGDVIPEHKFRGNYIVPEWGLKYDGKLLLYEHCTYDNFQRGKVKAKVTMYKSYLSNIENQFEARANVIFVIEDTRRKVDKWIQEHMPVGHPFLFTDYDTFLRTPIGEQLIDPMDMYALDGFPYPLESEDA